jgi:hypothetical protein
MTSSSTTRICSITLISIFAIPYLSVSCYIGVAITISTSQYFEKSIHSLVSIITRHYLVSRWWHQFMLHRRLCFLKSMIQTRKQRLKKEPKRKVSRIYPSCWTKNLILKLSKRNFKTVKISSTNAPTYLITVFTLSQRRTLIFTENATLMK